MSVHRQDHEDCRNGVGRGVPLVYGADGGSGVLARVGVLWTAAPDARSLCNVLSGNFVRQVLQTGTGEQKMERHTEQTKPTSTIALWQKHAARKSTFSCVGTASVPRSEAGERKLMVRNCNSASRRSRYRYEPPVKWEACCRNTASGPKILHTSMVTLSFWAEKIEFIRGIYDVDKSGETERIRIRASGGAAAVEDGFAGGGGCVILLI